jgi:hypothetical protein
MRDGDSVWELCGVLAVRSIIASRRKGTRARNRGQLAVVGDVKSEVSQNHKGQLAHGVAGCKQNMQGWKKKRRTRNRRRAQCRMDVDRQWERLDGLDPAKTSFAKHQPRR